MTRKALVIGIDDYPSSPLNGCVNDAMEISSKLSTHGSGSPNFDVMTVTSNEVDITTGNITKAINKLLEGEPEVALFYFSGHGRLKDSKHYLCSVDMNDGNNGYRLSDLIQSINRALGDGKTRNCIVLLDCCFSGGAGNLDTLNDEVAALGKGVTILTASRSNEPSYEVNGYGVFTNLLVDALSGSAADILGRITMASIYNHIDKSLGAWDQRPLYKSHVDSFLTVREVEAKVSIDTLRKLPYFFNTPADEYQLTPEHEHTNDDGTPKTNGNSKLHAEFRELQDCNRQGLVEPVGAKDMYWASQKSGSCRLTALGAHFHRLASEGRI